jgi:hypothetical protein
MFRSSVFILQILTSMLVSVVKEELMVKCGDEGQANAAALSQTQFRGG